MNNVCFEGAQWSLVLIWDFQLLNDVKLDIDSF